MAGVFFRCFHGVNMQIFITYFYLICIYLSSIHAESIITNFKASQIACDSVSLSWEKNAAYNGSDYLLLEFQPNSTSLSIFTAALNSSSYTVSNLFQTSYSWTVQPKPNQTENFTDPVSTSVTLVAGTFSLNIVENQPTAARLVLNTSDPVTSQSFTIYYSNTWLTITNSTTVQLTNLSSYVQYLAYALVNTTCSTNIRTGNISWNTPATSPTAPIVTQITAYATNVILQWQESQFNGEKLYYTVDCLSTSDSKNANTTDTSYTLVSLLPASTYSCNISALNKQNFSSTTPVNFTTLHQISTNSVENVTFQNIVNDSTSLLLAFPANQSFRYNAYNGNPIGYLIQLYPAANSTSSCIKQIIVNAENPTLPFNELLLQNDSWSRYNSTIQLCPAFNLTEGVQSSDSAYSLRFYSLSPATSYKALVFVVNRAGPGTSVTYTNNTFDATASSPLNVTISNKTDTSFSVTWQPPSSPTSYGPITYNLEVTGSSTQTYSTNEPFYTISNRTACSSTSVRVTLVNQAGLGNWSDSIRVVTRPSYPVDPINVNVTTINSRTQYVAWNNITIGQCAVLYHVGQCNNSSMVPEFVKSATDSYVDVTNLKPYTQYSFSVQSIVKNAINESVMSNWSQCSQLLYTYQEPLLAVVNISCTQLPQFLSTLMCSWFEPNNQVGVPLLYQGSVNQSGVSPINTTKTSLTFTNLSVQVGVSVTVLGFSQLGQGASNSWNGFLIGGSPSLAVPCGNGSCLYDNSGCPTLNPDTSTQQQLVLPIYVFSRNNGEITGYQLLISRSFISNYSGISFPPEWSTNADNYSINVNISGLSSCGQSISARRRRDVSSTTKLVYLLGNTSEDTCKTSPKNCNGPLAADTTYYVAFRGSTAAGSNTVGPFTFKTSKTSSPSNTGLIIGVIVGVVLIVVLVIVSFVFVRRYVILKKPSEKDSLTSGLSDEPVLPRRPTLSMQLGNTFCNSSFRRLFGSVSRPTTRNPIPVSSLRDAYRLGSGDGDRGFHQQYQELCKFSAANRKYVRHEFDRYMDIGTVPRSEDIAGVKLRPIYVKCEEAIMDGLSLGGDGVAYPPTEYINATYIPNKTNPQWIATQGPVPSSVGHFWWLVWQENPWIIVMLTGIKEKGITKCETYFPGSDLTKESESMEFPLMDASKQTLGDLRLCVELIYGEAVRATENSEPTYVQRTFRITVGEESRNVLHLQFSRWADHSSIDINLLQQLFSGFYQLRSLDSSHRVRPVIIHCSAGVGRTGTFIALSKLMDEIRAGAREIDIFGTVRELRTVRTNMVQTEEQLKLIYEYLMRFQDSREASLYASDVRASHTSDITTTMTHRNPAYQNEHTV